MDRRIADYITANRHRYTREAIRQRLVDAGFDPTEIDATWAALDTPDPDATAGPGFWGRFWLYLVGANVAVLLIVGLLTGMIFRLADGGFGLLVVLGIALVIGALIAWGVVAVTRPTQLGRGTAIAIGAIIPLVIAFLIGGTCYALVGALPPPRASGVMEVHIDPPVAFDGSGSASCLVSSDQRSFSIDAEALQSVDGDRTASVGFFGEGPAPASVTTLFITLYPSGAEAQPRGYTSGPGSKHELEMAPDGLSGTLIFQALPPDPAFDAPGGPAPTQGQAGREPISGTVTWSCE